MFSSLVIGFTRVVVFVLMVACGIISMYAATDAVSVYAGHSLFVAGLMTIAFAVLLNPLFCFIALYGLKWRLGIPTFEAIPIVLPLFAGWSIAFVRIFLPKTTTR